MCLTSCLYSSAPIVRRSALDSLRYTDMASWACAFGVDLLQVWQLRRQRVAVLSVVAGTRPDCGAGDTVICLA